MHASRQVIFLLAFFVALVSAVPLHHRHRRSQCHHITSTAVSSAPTPTRAAVEVASHSGTPTPSYAPSYASSYAPSHSSKAEGPKETSKASSDSSSDDSASSSDDSTSSDSTGSSGGGLLEGLLSQLFPVSDSLSSWTTSPSNDALPLADSTFRPEKEITALTHSYVNAPDGKKSMRAQYPKGSYNFGHNPQGGFSFYAPGPENVDLSTAKEATFAYSVYFPKGFDFVKGGKLPGLYGGNSEEEAVSCSGGRRDDGCFSARLMWREDGKGELYTYLPPSFDENEKVCNVAPESDCNPTYGASVGRGSFKFATGQWTTVTERVRLNDPGKANGQLQLWANGESVINVDGLVLRNSADGLMRGMQVQTFYGGSSEDFAATEDSEAYFSDFSIAITEKL